MASWLEFMRGQMDRGASASTREHFMGVGCYSHVEEEYATLQEGAALIDRSYRGLLEITGADRASWLHNLTTNQVQALQQRQGNYAFVLNLKGRILFDVNILVDETRLWLDIDREFLDLARRHLDKYTITEDVTIRDRSDDFVRLGLAGQHAAAVLAETGTAQASAMAVLDSTELAWSGTKMIMFRNDFCGTQAFELFVPADKAVEFWKMLTDRSTPSGVTPVGDDAVEIRRIEAGIPRSGREINQDVLPAETDQLQRAVSFNKGCYLGQEVVERMRSRDVVARQLVGLRIDGSLVPPCGAALQDQEGKSVGILTSTCRSIALGCPIGLGYVKSVAGKAGSALRVVWDNTAADTVVAALPFVPGESP